MREQLWDDEAFLAWVDAGAEKRGMTRAQVLDAAGLTRFYLRSSGYGRNTNAVLNIARVLKRSPGQLFLGWAR